MEWPQTKALLDSVNGKWVLAVLANLKHGPMRPRDLVEAINTQSPQQHLAEPVLAKTLTRMTARGLLERHEESRLPWVVRYELTPWARELLTALAGLDTWYGRRRDARH